MASNDDRMVLLLPTAIIILSSCSMLVDKLHLPYTLLVGDIIGSDVVGLVGSDYTEVDVAA